MDARLARRVQRYGWDRAAAAYEPLWQEQLACAQERLLSCARIAAGERVLDVACGTGLVALAAAQGGASVLGVDLSGAMVEAATARAHQRGLGHASFARMDAENLALPDAAFDVVLCGLGLMYMPEPARALREMRRVLRPGGRLALAVWGERAACGWAAVFGIVDAEVKSDVCPLFFSMGAPGELARRCADAGFQDLVEHRLDAELRYASAEDACAAALVGGPVALAWSRFDDETRARVRARYLAAIAAWKADAGYALPGRFVVVAGTAPAGSAVD